MAYILWALVNIGDKYVVGKRITNPYFYAVVGFFAGTISLVVLPFIDFYIPSLYILFWLFLSSLGFFAGAFLYLKAMSIEEVSRISILFNFLGIFTLILAWIFIGEKLNNMQLTAFGLWLCGSIFASLHFNAGKFKISKALILMLTSCFFYASYDVINRYLMVNNYISFSLIFVYLNFFILFFCSILFLSSKFRTEWKKNIQGILDWKLILIVLGIAAFSRFGVLLHNKAVSLGPVALINVMEGFQTILVFIFAGLISWLAPKYIKEEWDAKNFLLKFLALIFMVAGIVVLNVM